MENLNIVNFNVDYNGIEKRYYEFLDIGEIYYPLKTNSNIALLKFLIKIFDKNNSGFLISHLSHFNKLKKLGVNPKKMCLINVLAEDDFVKDMYKKGVRYFTFDNVNSLNEFLKYANLSKVRISVRLCISEIFNEFSHLGGNLEECKEMLKLLSGTECKNFGLSFYLQKEVVIKENALDKMLDFIISNFNGYRLDFVNIGGSKRPSEINLNKINEVKSKFNINKIILEPGRFLAGEFIDMETRIIKVKKVLDKNVIIIKNGIYSGLLDALLYNKKFDIRLKLESGEIKLNNEYSEETNCEIFLCGASSDSGDRLGSYFINSKYIEKLNINSKLVIRFAGAYVEEFFMPLGGDLEIKYNKEI